MDVYVQRERCNRINDNLAKPRGGDYWTGWKKIRKEKRVGARHRATDKRLSIREEIGSSRLRPLSKYTVTQYWHASLVKMLCVYKHIIYIYNFTKIKQRYWIVSIHIPGDRNVIYHLFESRKNTKESRVRNLGRFNFGKNCKKRREKEKNDGRQTGSRLCLLWKSRDTFSRKKEKKNCWFGLIATWKSSWGERRRLTGPRDRSSAKEHEWGRGKKATHVSRPIEWGESRASFPIQATCDTNSQIVDKGNGATGQRGGKREREGRCFRDVSW